MARKSRLDDDLKGLEELRRDPPAEAPVAVLEAALSSRHGLLIAKAATIIREQRYGGFGGALESALGKLLEAAWSHDPGCEAKCAIVEAMGELGLRSEDLWLRGIRHQQMEPVWGKSIDTAGRLRGLCLHELAAVRHPDAPYEIVRLLHDKEPEARETAAEAAGMLPQIAAELLLRHKILSGDAEARVTLMCFEQLAAIAAAESMDFFAEQLQSEAADIFEGAALAIASSHQPTAFPLLSEAFERRMEPRDRTLLISAIALLRSDDSLAFLLTVIEDGATTYARAAVKALTIWQGHDDRVAQIKAAVESRGDREVLAMWRETFEGRE
jgi:hypothetical protein